MPRGDRTGPWGEGPMTGRRAGYCAGNDAPGYMNPGQGGGFGGYGMGRGRRGGSFGGGRGYRHWFRATGIPGWMRGRGAGWRYDASVPAAPVSREQRMATLAGQAKLLEQQLVEIRREIESLASGEETESE